MHLRSPLSFSFLIVAAVAVAPAMEPAQIARMEAVFTAMRSATGAVFITDGREVPAAKAAAQMEIKFRKEVATLATPEAFIDTFVALSPKGTPFLYRSATGAEVAAAQQLKAWLPQKP